MVNSTYKLINPYIKGEFKNEFKASSPKNAAKNSWEALSEYIVKDVPTFAYSLMRNSDGKIFDFVVKEEVNDDDVDYKIEELNLKRTKKVEKDIVKKIEDSVNKSMVGGRHRHHRDDDDSSSSSDIYLQAKYNRLLNTMHPFDYIWYNPLLYNSISSIYIPTFIVPYTPYFEISYVPLC